jgi:hypothetical protein
VILLYQWCQGLRRRPYRVFLRSQYSSFAASGSPMADGWFNNGDFVIGEDALAECVLAVPLFSKGAPSFDCHADEQLHRVWAKNRSLFLWLGPNAILVVAEDYDAGLRS